MSKKLLSEAVMRRFAKLANLEPVNEMRSQGYDDREDEKLSGEHGAEAGFSQSKKDRRDDAGFEMRKEDAMSDIEDEVDTALPPGEEVEMDAGEEDIVPEPEMDMEGGAENEGLASDVLSAVAGALEAALGVDIEIDGGEEEMEMDAGEAEMDMDLADDEEMDMEDEEIMAEALRGVNYIPGRKEIVNEVAKRVATRLLRAKKAERQLAEALGKSQKPTIKRKAPRRRIKK
tara:strand:+ start:6092 stop:6784 length:693 start_codon:yes stop_codon:yes gene_type:complete